MASKAAWYLSEPWSQIAVKSGFSFNSSFVKLYVSSFENVDCCFKFVFFIADSFMAFIKPDVLSCPFNLFCGIEIIATFGFSIFKLEIFSAKTFPISYAPFLLSEEIYERYSPESAPMSEIITGIFAFFDSFKIVEQEDELFGETIIAETLSFIAFIVFSNSVFGSLKEL